jgi:hypothetical protein
MIRGYNYIDAHAIWVKVNRTNRDLKVQVTRSFDRRESGYSYSPYNLPLDETYNISSIFTDTLVLNRTHAVPFFVIKLIK